MVGLSYYATHPQSYYGKGKISADFVGLARSLSEQTLAKSHDKLPLVHFNGAAGNVAAGKYNDGTPPNRQALAGRLSAGTLAAWEDAKAHTSPISAADLDWRTVDVKLPARDILDVEKMTAILSDTKAPERDRIRAARDQAARSKARSAHDYTRGPVVQSHRTRRDH